MTHKEYIAERLTNRVMEQWTNSHQCVGQVKHRARLVCWIILWTFNWSAKKATYKTGWTFDPAKREQMTPWPWKDLKQWDILIQSDWQYGHIWVVHRATDKGYYMIEQNAKTGLWSWLGWDAILIWRYGRSDKKILNFYRIK